VTKTLKCLQPSSIAPYLESSCVPIFGIRKLESQGYGGIHSHDPPGYARAWVFCGIRNVESCQEVICWTFRTWFSENQVRNIPQITPYSFSAFCSEKIPHFCGSQNYRSLTLYNRGAFSCAGCMHAACAGARMAWCPWQANALNLPPV